VFAVCVYIESWAVLNRLSWVGFSQEGCDTMPVGDMPRDTTVSVEELVKLLRRWCYDGYLFHARGWNWNLGLGENKRHVHVCFFGWEAVERLAGGGRGRRFPLFPLRYCIEQYFGNPVRPFRWPTCRNSHGSILYLFVPYLP